MKRHYIFLLFLCFLFISCNNNYIASKYSFGNYSIIRHDWNNVMTLLLYFDASGTEIGSALFYYPGRDGWFLIDNAWEDNCIHLVLCDACPKFIINDSSQFDVVHDYTDIHSDKSSWVRMSFCNDEIPVVQETNTEYGTQVIKTPLVEGPSFRPKPNWNTFPGQYYAGSE